MTSTYTTNKAKLEKPAAGDYVDTWATPVNADWDAVDAAFGATTSLNVTSATGTVALSASQTRCNYFAVTGTLTANVTYELPSGVGGTWIVNDGTTGAFALKFSSGGGGTQFTSVQGTRTIIFCDGTNVAAAINAPTSPIAGNLEITGDLLVDGKITAGAAINGAQSSNVASSSTINLDAATGNYVVVTGTTTITAITLAQGAERVVQFSGALTLTNGASLVLPGLQNITTAAGDVAFFQGGAAGVVKCTVYTRQRGGIYSVLYTFDGSAPAAGTYTLDAYVAAEKVTINYMAAGNGGSGSMTVSVRINGTNITGLASVAVASSSAVTNASGANTITQGQKLDFVIAAAPTAAAGAFVQIEGTYE